MKLNVLNLFFQHFLFVIKLFLFLFYFFFIYYIKKWGIAFETQWFRFYFLYLSFFFYFKFSLGWYLFKQLLIVKFKIRIILHVFYYILIILLRLLMVFQNAVIHYKLIWSLIFHFNNTLAIRNSIIRLYFNIYLSVNFVFAFHFFYYSALKNIQIFRFYLWSIWFELSDFFLFLSFNKIVLRFLIIVHELELQVLAVTLINRVTDRWAYVLLL